jgi:hypothetical protein
MVDEFKMNTRACQAIEKGPVTGKAAADVDPKA